MSDFIIEDLSNLTIRDIEQERLNIFSEMKKKHNIYSTQDKLPLPILQDLIKIYDKFLNGEISQSDKNFKFMIRPNLPNKTQLSYWMVAKERNTGEQNFKEWSFVVFISTEMWKKLWTPNFHGGRMPTYEPNVGQKYIPGQILTAKVGSNNSFGGLMLFVEYYIAVFLTVSKYGHSSQISEKRFLSILKQEYENHFGPCTKENIWCKEKLSIGSMIYNIRTEEVGQVFSIEPEGFAVFKTRSDAENGPIVVWPRKEISAVRYDLYQGQAIRK